MCILVRRYADYAGSKINEAFDYTHGIDLWKEKLDYTNSWLSAHISDANAIGKPLVVEEFGKAKAAAKVYTGEFPHGIVPGECIFQSSCRVLGTSAPAPGLSEAFQDLGNSTAAVTTVEIKRRQCHWEVPGGRGFWRGQGSCQGLPRGLPTWQCARCGQIL